MMTRLAWLAVAVAVIPILALLSFQLLGSHESAHAQSTVNFDFDMDPGTGGTQDCVRCNVAGGDMGDGLADCIFDVVVGGNTLAPEAYDAVFTYDDPMVDIVDWGFGTTLTFDCGPSAFVTCDVASSAGFSAGQSIQFGPPNAEVTTVVAVPSGTQVQVLNLANAHSTGDPVFGSPAFDDLIKLPGATSVSDLRPDSDGTFAGGAVYTAGGPGIAGDGTIMRVGVDVLASPGLADFSFTLTGYTSAGSVIHPTTSGPDAKLAINQDCAPPPDSDDDGFSDAIESYLGTDPLDNCPDVVGSHDAWPLDMNMDTYVTVVGDVLTYRGNVGKDVATYPDVQRLDLNMDDYITVVGDVLMYRGEVGGSCT